MPAKLPACWHALHRSTLPTAHSAAAVGCDRARRLLRAMYDAAKTARGRMAAVDAQR